MRRYSSAALIIRSTAAVNRAEKVGYMKLLADARSKPFRAFPVITIVAQAID
jgi:hypothetical protein